MPTLDRGKGNVEDARRRRGGRGRLLVAALLAACVTVALARVARAEPAFGDSDWVAPGAGDDAGAPADPGPRVAGADHDPVGETVLRAPFRLLFLPFRLLARGGEKLVGLAGLGAPSSPATGSHGSLKFTPIVTSDPGGGVKVSRMLDPARDSKISASGIYAMNDRRKAKLAYRSAAADGPFGIHAEAAYVFKPNTTFFGVGNFTRKADKTIWLSEESRLDGLVHFGAPVRHEVRLVGSYSRMSARSGYNGAAGVLRVEDRFTPAEVPFLLRGSAVASIGLAADVGTLDDVRNPSRGVAARLRAEQFKATDSSDLEYRRYRTEARAYVPVFSPRRVLALRVLHDWVEHKAGSPAIPYYRMPQSDVDLRFNGYDSRRFTDNHLVLGQLEYRWWITNKVFALLNANVGEVASTAKRLRYADLHEAYGLGFRYAYTDRFAGRLDLAKGNEGVVLNLSLEETF